MTIAVDAMGGDNAPRAVCLGAAAACREFPDIEIALTGDEAQINTILEPVEPEIRSRLHVIHTEEVIGMDEHPVEAIRKKHHSSMRVAMEMVRSGEAQGFISAGNTGAIVAGGVLIVGRVPGIDRPALGSMILTIERPTFMLDMGATVRCKPENLYQFALMGSVYSRKILKVENPEVTLLSNGTEEIKGDECVAGARDLLMKSAMNFKGYTEGNDIVWGRSDVLVCDGFTGNVALKLGEGLIQGLKSLLTDEVKKSLLAKTGMALLLPTVKRLWTRFNYEKYGGAPLLGVKGAVLKAHGRSKEPAFAAAISAARSFIEEDGVGLIQAELEMGPAHEIKD
ncbi:MAG: phosphate acyltransferase PlsX [Synergistaceae bacterium]|nr:phosphate acyltransferase PlsX [Synergistaceae bacterium]